MSAQFTPGPWAIHVEPEHNLYRTASVFVCGEEGWPAGQLARVNVMDGLDEQAANARLIARAPEMIAALCQYRDDLRYPPAPDSIQRRLEMVEKLISEALTGETQ